MTDQPSNRFAAGGLITGADATVRVVLDDAECVYLAADVAIGSPRCRRRDRRHRCPLSTTARADVLARLRDRNDAWRAKRAAESHGGPPDPIPRNESPEARSDAHSGPHRPSDPTTKPEESP